MMVPFKKYVLFLCYILVCNAWAHPKVDLTPYQRALNSLTLQANIIQKNDDRTRSHGKIYIQRPGKIRITYYPQNTFDIISDGKKIIQYDGRKKQSHSTSVTNTPFAFLLNTFSFHNNKEILVKAFRKGREVSKIEVYNKRRPHSGYVKLYFTENQKKGPQLLGWTLVGPQGQKTAIHLSHVKINAKIPDHYFRIEKA